MKDHQHEKAVAKFLKEQPWVKAIASKANKKQKDKRRRERKRQKKEFPSARLATPIPKLGKPHPDYTFNDNFHKCREWKQLRYLALRNCGFACQVCGATAADGVVLSVDHVLPRYTHPHLALCIENLGVLCMDCNEGKGAWDSTDYRVHFRSI